MLDRIIDQNGELVNNLFYSNKDNCIKKVDYQNKNCIINFDNESQRIEIVFYKKEFLVPKYTNYENEMICDSRTFTAFESLLSQRKFKKINGIAVPQNDNVSMLDLDKTITRGGKRAKDNFYNYALSNFWEYFCTYTFENEDIRTNLNLLSRAWSIFVMTLQKKYPNVKVLAVPEPFQKETSGFHLHALMANCDLPLIPKRYKPNDKQDILRQQEELTFNENDIKEKDINALIDYVKTLENVQSNKSTQKNLDTSKLEYGQFMYAPFGSPRMQCTLWKKGFNEVVMIDPKSEQLQVVHYISKYMSKGFNLPYGSRRYYKTSNLSARFNYIENYSIKKFYEIVGNLNLKHYDKCKNDGLLVYRNF